MSRSGIAQYGFPTRYGCNCRPSEPSRPSAKIRATETSAAVSDARINPDGSLSHSLENKTDDREIPTQRPIEYRDSIVYRDREVEVEKIVEVERKLTWWQQTQIRGFWVAIIIILVLLRKKIFPLIRRFI